MPAYLQIADLLERELRGRRAGTVLPSEHELAAAHHLNRLTARAALEELRRRYLVRRTQGCRTFVARRHEYGITSTLPPSWSEAMRIAGSRPRNHIEQLRLVTGPASVREALGVAGEQRLLLLRRTRHIDDELVGCADTWLVAELVPLLAEQLGVDGSLHCTLVDLYGLVPRRLWTRAELVVAPVSVARRLGELERPFVYRIEGETQCRRRRIPIEHTISWLRADAFRVVFSWGSTDERR
jgi:GntR family transcriptional regulator